MMKNFNDGARCVFLCAVTIVLYSYLDGPAGSGQILTDPADTAKIREIGQLVRNEATYKGNFFKDIANHPVHDRRGTSVERVAYLAPENINTLELHIDELPPGEFNDKSRNIDEIAYVFLAGRGYTVIEPVGGKSTRYDWQAGDLLVVPVNAWHQAFNADANKAARFLVVDTFGMTKKLGLINIPDAEGDKYRLEGRKHAIESAAKQQQKKSPE